MEEPIEIPSGSPCATLEWALELDVFSCGRSKTSSRFSACIRWDKPHKSVSHGEHYYKRYSNAKGGIVTHIANGKGFDTHQLRAGSSKVMIVGP